MLLFIDHCTWQGEVLAPMSLQSQFQQCVCGGGGGADEEPESRRL